MDNTMPSFDTVCEANLVEVKNAVDNAAKEIGTRFDFKGTSAAIELNDKEITLFLDECHKLPADLSESLLTVLQPNAEKKNTLNHPPALCPFRQGGPLEHERN